MLRDKMKLLALMFLCSYLLACAGGGGSADESDDDSSADAGGAISAAADNKGLSTACGVIVDNSLRQPVDPDRGEAVSLVSVLDSNAVIVSKGSEQLLVKLQGIGGTTGFNNTAAAALYVELAAEPLYFFQAGECTGTVIGGQTGTLGQIVTESGKSFTEQALARKYAGVIQNSGSCGEEILAGCYSNVTATNEHHAYGPTLDCDETVPLYVRYRVADTDCGGNASVVVSGPLADAFSIQLRYPDGTDRIVESCEDASCTPLKVQDYIRTEDLTVGCFGAPGNSNALSDVNHVSVKREGDDHEPPRFCILNPAQSIN